MIRLTVGPMFADKTTSLIASAKRTVQRTGSESVVVIVPTIDQRSGPYLRSHAGEICAAMSVATAREFQAVVYPRPNLKHVVVDEVQFFGSWVVRELVLLSRRRIQLDVAGLLHDYRGAPFENTMQLIPFAEEINHKTATCVGCGEAAAWTHRKTHEGDRVVVGGAETYEPRCRRCWEVEVSDAWVPWEGE